METSSISDSNEPLWGWKKDVKKALDTVDSDTLNTLLTGSTFLSLFELGKALKEESWIFTSLCKLGLNQSIEHLLTIHTLDVNMFHNEWTGIQLASQAGHSKVVEILLHYGARLKENAWEQDSEFYLATLHGHKDVVDILLKANPEVLSDSEALYCLFHCACKGGHLPLVQRWQTPNTDVNREIAYVPSLNDCEHQYPLFAACKGGHYEVAQFLMEFGARITKDICFIFPKFTCHLVRTLLRKSSHSKEQTFEMNGLDLVHIMSEWFEDSVTSDDERPSSYSNIYETKIDLSDNWLSSLPPDVLWHLPSLVHLNVSHNPLTDLPYPLSDSALHKHSLTCLMMSHCKIKKMNIHIFLLPNLEELDVSCNELECLYEEDEATCGWKCHQLKSLNLSHNRLSMLPSALQACTNLESLCLSNNVLINLCSAWQCPLKSLDISHNQLSTFPPSSDQFWSDSLQFLNASHNLLTQLPESMVKMDCLKNLNVSFNAIMSLPEQSMWTSSLLQLNLSHNKLGHHQLQSNKVKRSLSLKTSFTPLLELSAPCLTANLNELFLNDNDLHTIPEGICHLQALTVLDISRNAHLNVLPLEIGMLWNLLVLKADGISVEDKEVQGWINELNKKTLHTYDFVMHMEQRRRDCMHHDLIKLVVFGCKNSGGQCIVQSLTKQGRDGEKQKYYNEHKTLCISNWNLPYARKFHTQFKRDLKFEVWEFPITKHMAIAHPCFLTQNSLYIIVHDAMYDEDDLDKVSQQIAMIQASVSLPFIIVVCLFQSSKDKKFIQDLNQVLHTKIMELKCHYVPYILSDKTSLASLNAAIYSKVCQMPDVMQGKKSNLVNRKVPRLFIDLVDKIKTMNKQICSRDELLLTLGLEEKDLQDTVDRRLRLQEYLLQVGAMLHYNVLMGDLCNLVILDPVWLYDLFNSFMEFLSSGNLKLKQIGSELVKIFIGKKIGEDLYPAFISLLELFNVGIRLQESNGNESLLIPSLLPKQPPAFLSDDIDCGLSTSRLYCLPVIPKSLWSHVISQLIPAFERFSDPYGKLPEFLTQTEISDDVKKSFRKGTRRSMARSGLCVKNKGIQCWRTGIMVWHDQGLIVVEEVQYLPESVNPTPGILVTVKTRRDPTKSVEVEFKENLKKLAVIGVVTDELEEILELFNPKLIEFMQDYKPTALCPHCHGEVKPGHGTIGQEIDHFQVNVCAQRILWEDVVFCRKKPVFLNQLIPEFMFLELPNELCIPFESLQFQDEKLGQGMAGTVTKGRYKEMDVAIKSFYTPTQEPLFDEDNDPMYPNIGTSDTCGLTLTQQDSDDTEKRKIFNAFMELRREVSILSKLKHKCIIAFLGVCVKRHLLLVLELAPLGSFRTQLTEMKKKKNIPVYKPSVSEPAVVTQSIFGKDLSYKILLQITSGLSYLHSQSIIFRDLKPDNILVLSLDLEAEINVKVSDYGISKFSTAKGVSGMVGTLCYMAPEVLAKQTYTNKVDVYSLGIVMFETLTGIAPTEVLGSNQKPMLSEISKASAEPPHVKLYKVNCNFPYMESLMEECWAFRMDNRPSVKQVIKRMSSDHFLLLHDVLWSQPSTEVLQVTCIYACLSTGRTSLWISESPMEGEWRYLSVYDLASSMYTARRKKIPGPKITAMAKVRDKIWLISEGSKEIEQIVRSTHNKFEVRKGMVLDEQISCLMCHKWKPPKADEDHSFVLIGHTNGTMTTSHVHTAQYRTVSTTTQLSLTTHYPISSIVTFRNDSLIAAAGHSIFLLVIQEQTSGDGLSHPSISLASSFSFYKNLDIQQHLSCMVADERYLWCSFEGKSQLIKFDWEEQTVEEHLSLLFDLKRDVVNVTGKISSPHKPAESCDNSSSIELSSCDSVKSNSLPPIPVRTYPQKETGSKTMQEQVDSKRHNTMNFPAIVRRRPTPPLRKSTLTDILGITSLCKISDLLAVGTDCGGLFLLPISISLKNACPSPQFSMMWHPQKPKVDGTGTSRKLSSLPPVNFHSVSKMVQIGNKLISLLKNDCFQVLRNKNMDTEMKNRGSKRLGSVFDPQTGFSNNVVNNTACVTLQPPPAAIGGKEVEVDTLSINAELVIWDDVSDKRLSVIKGYRNGFI